MCSVTDLAPVLQPLFTTVAHTAARDSGFVQRVRVFTGATFVQTLVFGWLGQPAASLTDLTHTATTCGAPVSRQALDQRFTPQAADCLCRVLHAALARVVRGHAVALPILHRFTGVYLWDSTTLTLPDALAPLWPGCGGRVARNTQAALKVQARWEFTTGVLDWLTLTPGSASDRTAARDAPALPPGSLRLTDLGYVSLSLLTLLVQQGVWVLCRFPAQPLVYPGGSGTGVRVGRWLATRRDAGLDLPVWVGKHERLPCRLLAVRVSEERAEQRRRQWRKEAKRDGHTVRAERLAMAAWDVWLTTLPPERLTLAEARVLMGVRWQIELVFKRWKSGGGLGASRSTQPWRVLCEVYAKLTAQLVAHWCVIRACWQEARRSMDKAVRVVRAFALLLATTCGQQRRLRDTLRQIGVGLRSAGAVGRRKTRPATADQLLALAAP